jgi:excisionase family DNA binding protein
MPASTPNVPKLLLTEAEAAERLTVSRRTLWGLRAAGAIPSVRIGKLVRYDPADLAAYIERQKCTAQTA